MLATVLNVQGSQEGDSWRNSNGSSSGSIMGRKDKVTEGTVEHSDDRGS